MTTAMTTIAPVVTVGGQALSAAARDNLVTLRVNRALGLIGRATLRFNDDGYPLATSGPFTPGAAVEVALGDGTALFSGAVTGVSLEQSAHEHPELVVIADDRAFGLTRGTSSTTYASVSFSDVIAKLAQRAGLQSQVDASTQSHDYLIQTGSDLAYLNALTRRIGFVWWVDGSTLHVTKSGRTTGSVSLALGAELRAFSVRASALHPTSVTVAGWDPDVQNDVIGKSSASAGSAAAFVSGFTGTPRGMSPAPVTTGADQATTLDEAATLAQARYEAGQANAVTARGVCAVNGAIKPSTTVKVANAGPASGDYLASEVEHTYSRSGFVTSFVCGPTRPAGLVDTLGGVTPDAGFAINGLIVGVVSNAQDSNNPDSGRCKIKYVGAGGAVESAWARIVALGGGPNRGVTFAPEVNDEVLVGFERGDTRRPVVLGGLYSKKIVLPTGLIDNGAVNFRRISSRKGHLLEFADGTTPETRASAAAGRWGQHHRLRLGADRFDLEVASGKPLSIKAGDAASRSTHKARSPSRATNITIKADADPDPAGRRRSRAQGRHESRRARRDARAQGRRHGQYRRRRPTHPEGRDGDDQLIVEPFSPRPSDNGRYDATFIGRGFSWPIAVDHTGSIRLTDDDRGPRPFDPSGADDRAGRAGHAPAFRLQDLGSALRADHRRTCSG